MVKTEFHFRLVKVRKLVPDAFARDIARQFMHVQSQLEPLLRHHLAVPFDLHVQGRLWRHLYTVALG